MEKSGAVGCGEGIDANKTGQCGVDWQDPEFMNRAFERLAECNLPAITKAFKMGQPGPGGCD